ncbi:MAG: hypothetical protein MZU95_04550 [Desulfomicrobium escambiense]|nr:hypothetical protein [Desulfomicrobium escambiense]
MPRAGPPEERDRELRRGQRSASGPRTPLVEAERCLQCAKPACVARLPGRHRHPRLHQADRREATSAAAATHHATTNALPAVCGRVCPQENQCEERLHRRPRTRSSPVAIGHLERFVADWAHAQGWPSRSRACAPPTGQQGRASSAPGPAGLTCGRRAGHGAATRSTVFEAFHEAGGVLVYGIPEFRLPKEHRRSPRSTSSKRLGVELRDATSLVGRTFTIERRCSERASTPSSSAPAPACPSFMGIPGENLNGVYSANEYLTRVQPDARLRLPRLRHAACAAAQRVAVIGGGNVGHGRGAHGAAPGRRVEATDRLPPLRARDAGPRSRRSTTPRRRASTFQLPDGADRDPRRRATAGSRACDCLRMELGEPDASGRRRPVPVRGLRVRRSSATWSSCAIGTQRQPAPRRRPARTSSSTSGATSTSTTRPWPPRCRASSPAATSSAARRPSSWPWATPGSPRRPWTAG